MTGDQRAAGDVADEHPGHCASCLKYCGWCGYRAAPPAGAEAP